MDDAPETGGPVKSRHATINRTDFLRLDPSEGTARIAIIRAQRIAAGLPPAVEPECRIAAFADVRPTMEGRGRIHFMVAEEGMVFGNNDEESFPVEVPTKLDQEVIHSLDGTMTINLIWEGVVVDYDKAKRFRAEMPTKLDTKVFRSPDGKMTMTRTRLTR